MSVETKGKPVDHSYRSETNKGVERPAYGSAGDGESFTGDIGTKIGDLADRTVQKVHHAADAANDVGHTAMKKAQNGHAAVCDFTKQNPTAALLMAFGVGAILARLLPKW